jgi:hypothetical protein
MTFLLFSHSNGFAAVRWDHPLGADTYEPVQRGIGIWIECGFADVVLASRAEPPALAQVLKAARLPEEFETWPEIRRNSDVFSVRATPTSPPPQTKRGKPWFATARLNCFDSASSAQAIDRISSGGWI